MAMGKGRAAAVVLTAVLGLALVAVCLHDEPTGAGGVAVLESSGPDLGTWLPMQKEPTEKSVEARIRSAHLLLRRRLAAGLAQERGRASLADSAASEVDVYFGGGCFWHMQHAFVQVAPPAREPFQDMSGELHSFRDAMQRSACACCLEKGARRSRSRDWRWEKSQYSL
ncbi:hypothetical protein T484DRAFT_1740878 [Baffinella frigidus]|nr:hypothetical protein T484DRAFT_1740878 [Cryptophyta sp. CCMP2293]